MESAKKLKRCTPEQIEILLQSFGKILDTFFLFNFKDIQYNIKGHDSPEYQFGAIIVKSLARKIYVIIIKKEYRNIIKAWENR